MTIKANKTKLYKLVAEHESLPPMKNTDFSKLTRNRAYWLEWWSEGSPTMEAYLTVSAGIASLRIGRKYRLPGDPDPVFYRLTIEDLRARGMLEE